MSSLRELAYRLASMTAERDSLRNQQPKLDNLTGLIVEQRGDIKRYQQLLQMKDFEIMRTRSKLQSVMQELPPPRRTTQIIHEEHDSIDLEKQSLKCGTKHPILTRGSFGIPENSNVTTENLIHELSKATRALEEVRNGREIKTFIDSVEYERIIEELKQTADAKNREIEIMKKNILVDNGDRSLAVKLQDSQDMVKTLERALYVKHSLVVTMNEHIEKLEKQLMEMEQKYAIHLETLREEQKQYREKQQLQDQEHSLEEAHRQQQWAIEQEKQQLEYKLEEYQKAYNKISEELEIKRSQVSAEKDEKEALEKQCQLLEEKMKNCKQCEKHVLEKQDIIKQKDEMKEELELVITQMKYYEEDFKHERKDREDMKNRYDVEIDGLQEKVKYFSEEMHRLGGIIRNQKQELEYHKKRSVVQHRQYEDTVTDHAACGHVSYAYGQLGGHMTNPWQRHSTLPSEVVADSAVMEEMEVKGDMSLGTHIARVCPRCEREFAPHQRDDFEKHVEKCLFTN